MSETAETAASPRPVIRTLGAADIRAALGLGLRDFRRAPAFGLFFSAVYELGGMFLYWMLVPPGNLVWALPVLLGFPLIAPFAAVGLYEVSRRLEAGSPLVWGEILGVVLRERNRQMPSMAVVIIFIFLVWVFIGHMIFALFMGLQVMTNVSTSFEVFLTPNGLTMLAVGTAVGAGFAFVLFAITVVALPLLLDREIDFVTAMITSFQTVTGNFVPMMGWAATITALLALGMLPFFLGLFVVLPVLGHATWHIYRRAIGFDA
ncbi:hypothetical protein DDZ14_15535 [Maritimibacter sp. 55A14]|uniref:DUF2189 domain-containing protein n=1 Tax=Maritimibacter sp. 55A14 TaxID=2174844 RepID=UPI000D6199F4|nr:DUF2189 domain-containing protein [Maritimibacter sp. 55A14]PWE30452.1 hypothetical protein DDZ14_15535 [Maritimibacter sp. 55A14]